MNFKNVKQLVLYGIFGVLTTVINIVAYWVVRKFDVAIVTSTVIAWLVAVFFAYFTNRKYVFESSNTSLIAIFFEALYFFACRIATGLFDVAFMYIFADLLGFDEVITKTVSNIIVIVLNYIASKLFIFKEARK
ncbi:MAG: GtrA family protein [Synergistaceae bacterium]|nr:GtrA family protein [Synergistaceae bacterium]